MSPTPSRALRSSRLVIPCLTLVAIALLAASSWAAPCGVFVSVNGTDTPTCGLSVNSTCRTINYGIGRAAGEGATCVFVQAGTYDEVLVVVPGIGVTGGFDLNWAPGPYDMAGHQVLVNGGADNATGGTGEFLAVRAHTPGAESRLAELVLAGPNATGAVGLEGRSSYVVHVSGATLTLDHVRLIAGNGAPGLTGTSGLDASSLAPAPAGGLGGNGQEFAVSCDNTSRGPGGAAGINNCASSPSSRSMNGGAGGPGGTMDTDCNIFNLNLIASPGIAGNNASFTSGGAGIGGPGGPANVLVAGGNGAAGISVNGAAGSAGSGGALTGSFWYASMGGPGGTGQNGSGGGGGGGAGGNDDGTDAYGAGGGGGGAGGCAARGGGGGGGGGGSSFGLAAVNGASVMLQDCAVERGQAATGGMGGTGGQGQPGGVGGLGGAHPGAAAAGTGGHGAHGGHGGGGGGGAGGSSYAVLQTTGSSVVTSNLTVMGGSLGAGGAGGISAPGAPAADDDGNDGVAGVAGQLGTTLSVVGPEPGIAARPAAANGSAAVCDISCVLDASGPSAPVPLSFEGAAPNPIVKGSMVRFGLPEPATVRIEVFDLGGRRVRALCDGLFPAGMHAIRWDGTLEGGGPARAGVYLLRFTALGASRTRSAIVVR